MANKALQLTAEALPWVGLSPQPSAAPAATELGRDTVGRAISPFDREIVRDRAVAEDLKEATP